MSVYDRKGVAHSRKVITSSIGSTKSRYSVEAAFQSSVKETRRKLSEHVSAADIGGSSIFKFNILEISSPRYHRRDYPQLNEKYFDSGNLQDVLEVRKVPTNFVGISKPSKAVDRLLRKRKIEHEDAKKNMKNELTECYEACEREFGNRSISVKIHMNKFRNEILGERDKLREMKDHEIAWKNVSALIENQKDMIDNFYNSLLIIEQKRQKYCKAILQKYYKIYHEISFLLPYEIQVYMENEILNYNDAVLGNHRIYADLNLQMRLLADADKMEFKNLIEELKIDYLEAKDISYH